MSEQLPTGWPGAPVAVPSLDSIREAAQRLKGTVVRTPLIPLVSSQKDPDIYLKPESQHEIATPPSGSDV
jgi:hypothetical protein